MPEVKLTAILGDSIKIFGASTDISLLSSLRESGLTNLHAPCGGNGTCRQCSAAVFGTVRGISSGEVMNADGDTLLLCRWIPQSKCTVILSDSDEMSILTSGASGISPCGCGLGVAVDIGTTTLAAYLYDLKSGAPLAVESARNAQRPFGADVISRIQYCSDSGGPEKLAGIIRDQIDGLIAALCEKAGRSPDEVSFVTIAGNTVMQHIFAGLSPESIGAAPFTPLSLFGDCRPSLSVLSSVSGDTPIYLCPALAGYVGGDITAGLLSSGAWLEREPCLFLDIGTNGEMGLGGQDGFVCCSTAAGPAFEGAEIECGSVGAPGAISCVAYEDGELAYTVIGGGEPSGICGSGLIDAVAALLSAGIIEPSGRIASPNEAPESLRGRLRESEAGIRFYLSEKVYITSTDVRKIQLAKAAIRAGIETLLDWRGMEYGDVSSVIIAGGFGAYMNVKSACAIGLLPPQFLGKTMYAGNCAGAGAAMALSPECRDELARLAKDCEYIELSSSRTFADSYMDNMIFEEY